MKNLFILLIIHVFPSTAVMLECIFIQWIWEGFDVYTCKAMNNLNIVKIQMSHVDEISGKHATAKSNDNVEGLKIENKNMLFFPQGIEKTFKNLKSIFIEHGRLKEVHQSDLMKFPQLKKLGLGHNDIEVLEYGLFDYNPELNLISFWGCKLVHIELDVFNKLSNLNNLWLPYNKCINSYKSNRTAVTSLIDELKTKCYNKKFSDEYNKISVVRETFKTDEVSAKIILQISQSGSVSQDSLMQLNQKVEKIDESLSAHRSDIGNRMDDVATKLSKCSNTDDISKLTQRIEKIETALETCQNSHEGSSAKIKKLGENLKAIQENFNSFKNEFSSIFQNFSRTIDDNLSCYGKIIMQ